MTSQDSDGEKPIPPAEPRLPPAWQYSLATLLVVMTLVGVVAAAFAWNVTLGILTYLGGFSLFMIVWRARADYRRPLATLFTAVNSSLAVGLAAAIAFAITCTVSQAPFTTPVDPIEVDGLFATGLFISIPVGTSAALAVFWFMWPTNKVPPQ